MKPTTCCANWDTLANWKLNLREELNFHILLKSSWHLLLHNLVQMLEYIPTADISLLQQEAACLLWISQVSEGSSPIYLFWGKIWALHRFLDPSTMRLPSHGGLAWILGDASISHEPSSTPVNLLSREWTLHSWLHIQMHQSPFGHVQPPSASNIQCFKHDMLAAHAGQPQTLCGKKLSIFYVSECLIWFFELKLVSMFMCDQNGDVKLTSYMLFWSIGWLIAMSITFSIQ